MQLQKFSAMFYYDFHSDLKYASLLFYYLRDRGVHIWEGRVGHLSVAHTDQDMDRVLQAFQESVEEMQAGGFLPESGLHSVRPERSKSSCCRNRELGGEAGGGQFPRMLVDSRWPKPSAKCGSEHRCGRKPPARIMPAPGSTWTGIWTWSCLRRAIRAVVQRHEGLRCTFSEDGTEAILHPRCMPEIPVHDLSGLPEPQREERVNEILHQEGRRLLDLTKGPLVDFQILKLSAQRHMLIFTAQMIVCDGWSHYVVFEDLGAIYTAFAGRRRTIP